VGIEPSGPIIGPIFDALVPWLFSQPRKTLIGDKLFQSSELERTRNIWSSS
jgi:hypothetical protein